MIAVKDINGNILDHVQRNERTGALVFSKTNDYQQYKVIKQQAERIAQLESQVERLLTAIESINNK